MDNKAIGKRIEMRRKQLNLTLEDIASDIGVARSTVQRYERGSIAKIKLPVIEAIARVLTVDPAWLCCKTDNMVTPTYSSPDSTHVTTVTSSAKQTLDVLLQELINNYQIMNFEGRQQLCDYSRYLAGQAKYKKRNIVSNMEIG